MRDSPQQLLQLVGMLDEIAEHVLQAAERGSRPGQPQRPPPQPLQADAQQIAQHLLGQRAAAAAGFPVDLELRRVQPLEVAGVVLDGALPHVRAGGVGLVVGRLEPPIVRGDRVEDVEIGLDRLVVAHLLAPEDLLAQIHLPAPRELAAALHLGLGDDLVPAVLSEIGGMPNVRRFVRDGRHALGQPSQHGSIIAADSHVLAGESRDGLARGRLVQTG